MDQTSLHVQRAVGGESESVEWVITHFQPLVEAQARLRLGRHARPEDVADMVQDLWVVTLQKLGQIEPHDGRYAPTLVRFLGATTLQLCNNFLRKRIRRREGLRTPEAHAERTRENDFEHFVRSTTGVATRANLEDVRNRIRSCLERMDTDKRDVLVMRFMEQRSNQEIALQLQLAPNTVAVRYRRALQQARGCLGEEIYDCLWSSRGPARHE